MPAQPNHPESSLDRRGFLQTSCAALLALGVGPLAITACDSGDPGDGLGDGAGVGDPGVTREGDTLVVDTSQFATLTAANGALWVSDVRVLVTRTERFGYRAFDGVCPHEGEGIRVFERSGDTYRLRCPAHDWTFDLDGDPTGRATRGTERLPLEQDGSFLRIALPR